MSARLEEVERVTHANAGSCYDPARWLRSLICSGTPPRCDLGKRGEPRDSPHGRRRGGSDDVGGAGRVLQAMEPDVTRAVIRDVVLQTWAISQELRSSQEASRPARAAD